jgi:hypothetical protein
MGITMTIATISWELIPPATIALPKQARDVGIYLGFCSIFFAFSRIKLQSLLCFVLFGVFCCLEIQKSSSFKSSSRP